MTVLRREDVHSRIASWDRCPYRMSRSPILAIVPLIIRRLCGPSPSRVIVRSPSSLTLVSARSPAPLERGPQKAGKLACDRHHNLGGRFMVGRQRSEAPTQSLLRLIRDRNDPPRSPLRRRASPTPTAGRCW